MLGNRIRTLRIEHELTQTELGKKFGVGKTTVSKWENDDSSPDIDTLKAMAKYFDVSVSYLVGADTVRNKSNDTYTVPVFRAVSCGNPFIADEDIIDYEDIDPKFKGQGEHFGLRLKGESMEPDFKQDDVVIVRKQSDVDSGQIAIVAVGNEDATMKIVNKAPEGITLIATNPNVYLPHFYSNEDIKNEPITILGRVVEQRRKL